MTYERFGEYVCHALFGIMLAAMFSIIVTLGGLLLHEQWAINIKETIF